MICMTTVHDLNHYLYDLYDDSSSSKSTRQGRHIPDLYDLYDLYDPAHVGGWEPHSLHDLTHFSWVGPVALDTQILHNIS